VLDAGVLCCVIRDVSRGTFGQGSVARGREVEVFSISWEDAHYLTVFKASNRGWRWRL
jgi:hypothetical protein